MEITHIKKEEKVAVYIDGNNFYKYLRAIKYIRHKNKRIEYVGFSHAPSLGMQKHADFSILLRPDDIDKFKEERIL